MSRPACLIALEAALPLETRINVLPEILEIEVTLNRKNKVLETVQKSLEDIRLNLTYLGFDLEATRRERDQYKAELEKLRG
jgi:hypothetical protein